MRIVLCDATSFTAAKAIDPKALMAECEKTKLVVFQDMLNQFLNKQFTLTQCNSLIC